MIRIQFEDFDVGEELERLRDNPKVGALVSFSGVVRDLNEGRDVSQMRLEHYPGMTEKAIEEIVDEAKRRWDILDVTVIHRVGTLVPMDQIVFVAVASAHRSDAFDACEFIMDYLKTRAPFWKKEMRTDGAHWVDCRLSDAEAVRRWEVDTAEIERE